VTVSRDEAVGILKEGRGEVRRLLGRLPETAMTSAGIGSGDWSALDLVGHLTSWEEHALEALDAWSRGERAWIDGELSTRGLNAVNAEAVSAKSKLTVDEVLHDAEISHASLVDAIRGITDAAWERPATSRGRKTLGHRLGQILGGPPGGFRHADAHLPSLRSFVERRVD
jgi:hypothetical protein